MKYLYIALIGIGIIENARIFSNRMISTRSLNIDIAIEINSVSNIHQTTGINIAAEIALIKKSMTGLARHNPMTIIPKKATLELRKVNINPNISLAMVDNDLSRYSSNSFKPFQGSIIIYINNFRS